MLNWVLMFIIMIPSALALSQITVTFLYLVMVLLAAKFSDMVEKFGQPPVLGEISIGIIIGNLALIGITFFNGIARDQFIIFLAQLGIVILLFQVGLETDIHSMSKLGWRAFLVACVGVVTPMLLMVILGPIIYPAAGFKAYLFLGGILSATSVGITAKVFKDLNALKTKEAQIVLGAAVIDDVLGLIVLAILSGLVVSGVIDVNSVIMITFKAVAFLITAIVLGQVAAKYLGHLFSKIEHGIGMKFTFAICICFIFAYLADLIGLAPIVGAFAAGLILDPSDFADFKKPEIVYELRKNLNHLGKTEKRHLDDIILHLSKHHIENLIEPLSMFLVPIFFVAAGINVRLETLFDFKILMIAVAIFLIAVVGKVAAGFVAGNVSKTIVGFGMIPRGEVGLIFASFGMSAGVLNDQLFSAMVIVILMTTLITPPILNYQIKQHYGVLT
jgi:Kef-type K+ transport system membrane component KefB